MEVTIDLDTVRRDIKAAEEALATLKNVEGYLQDKAAQMNGVHKTQRTTPTKKPGAKQPVEKPNQADSAAKILTELGRPAKTKEIVDIGIERGWFEVNSNRRTLENGVYGAMNRKKEIFYIIERGTWDLVSRKK